MIYRDDKPFMDQTIEHVDAQLEWWDWEDRPCWRCGELESEHYGLQSYCDPGEYDYEDVDHRDKSRVFARDPLPMLGAYEIGSLEEELAWEAMLDMIEEERDRSEEN